MAIKVKLDITEQAKAVQFVQTTYDMYQELTTARRNRMLSIYQEYSTFVQPRRAAWQTQFKVNKIHEVVNKILPRVIAKNPKRVVSSKVDELRGDKLLTPEERAARMEQLNLYSVAIRDYLTNIFDKYNLVEPIRLWAKNMIIYGNAWVKVKFKYEIGRSPVDQTTEQLDEEGNPIKIKGKKVEEYVWGEYPTVEVKSWSDMYFDPRYPLFSDMPGVIDETNGVRLADLKRNKKYINIDKLELMPPIAAFNDDPEAYKQRIFGITGMIQPDMQEGVDINSLCLKTYYGLYAIDGADGKPGDERMYEITVVNDMLLICFEEIAQNPFEEIRCFEDTETNFSWGFAEPILSLQRELNFKKNSASEYINAANNRSWMRNPNSGVNPRDLVSKPGGIIATTKSKDIVDQNLWELPMREIDSSFFQEQNDFERQIQAMTFTVDTSNPNNQQALTNTATGARIKFYESNVVIDETRKHLEQGMERLAYKFLQETYDNMDDNIVIKKSGEEGFWEINKEALKDAIQRFEIKVEAGSTSFETIESRRDDAIAKFNIGLEAEKAMPGTVNLKALLEGIYDQFEDSKAASYLNQTPPPGVMGVPQPGVPQGGGIPQQQQAPNTSEVLTQQVSGGKI